MTKKTPSSLHRLGVSPKVENNPDPSSPLPACFPSPPPGSLPLVSPTGHVSPPSVSHHTNPFTHPSPPTSISSNPFLTQLQRNPFFEELIAEEALKSPTEMSCYPNFPSGHYPAFLARPGLSSPASNGTPSRTSLIKRERPRSVARQSSLPALISGTQETASENVNASCPVSESGAEEDDFKEFATSRLKSPVVTPTRPPLNPISSSLPSHNSMEHPDFQLNNEVMVDKANERITDTPYLPPLPPRKPSRTPFPGRERGSDGWLDRGQELAVQKEASVLFQTDLASLQHVRETSAPLNKEPFMYFHPASLEQNINVCPSSHTAQIRTDGNLNLLDIGEGRVLAARGLGLKLVERHGLTENVTENLSHMNEGVQKNTVCTESDHIVPNMPYCLSDGDTTVSESLCSSYQTFPKPESSSELNSKPKTASTVQQFENVANDGNVPRRTVPARDSNNNTNDTSQFAFIDSDNSLSDVIQGTLGVIDKGNASVQHQDYDSSENIPSVCRSAPEIPEHLIKKMITEVETFSPKKTLEASDVYKDITSQQASVAAGAPMTQPRECVSDLKDVLISKECPLESNLRAESEDSGYKDSIVTPQTASILKTDDGSATKQLKPEALVDKAVLDAACEGGGYLTYELKTAAAELKTEEKNREVSVSQSRESCLTPQSSDISFEELHAQVAPRGSRSPFKTEVKSARIRTGSTTDPHKANSGRDSFSANTDINSTKPLHDSASTFPHRPTGFLSDPNIVPDPIAVPDSDLTSLTYPPALRPGLGSPPASAPSTTSTAQPQVAARHTLSPEEAQPASSPPPLEESR